MINTTNRLSHKFAILASSLLITLTSVASVSANTIYTWVDDNGVTHYSQQPPSPTDSPTNSAFTNKLYSEDIEPKRIGTVAPLKPITQNKQASELEKKAAAINLADKQQAQQVCENAKHSLNVLTTHTKLNKKNNETGEVVAMTEEQRQASIAEQNERIRLFCNT